MQAVLQYKSFKRAFKKKNPFYIGMLIQLQFYLMFFCKGLSSCEFCWVGKEVSGTAVNPTRSTAAFSGHLMPCLPAAPGLPRDAQKCRRVIGAILKYLLPAGMVLRLLRIIQPLLLMCARSLCYFQGSTKYCEASNYLENWPFCEICEREFQAMLVFLCFKVNTSVIPSLVSRS